MHICPKLSKRLLTGLNMDSWESMIFPGTVVSQISEVEVHSKDVVAADLRSVLARALKKQPKPGNRW